MRERLCLELVSLYREDNLKGQDENASLYSGRDIASAFPMAVLDMIVHNNCEFTDSASTLQANYNLFVDVSTVWDIIVHTVGPGHTEHGAREDH